MIDISILLPTRGRTDALKRSLLSLADQAREPASVEMLLAVDDDDDITSDWCREHILPELDQRGVSYMVMQFPRLGYLRLNEYVNALAAQSQGNWLMFWGDDAIMLSQDWDERIREVSDFRVLRMPTHNEHPYAIFPIVPRAWYELCGYLSAHQLTDSWVSQVAYLVGIMHNIDVAVTHDRFDITGNNNDSTYHERPMLEGNPKDPRDFNHINWTHKRNQDAARIAEHLRAQGQDVSWWDRVKTGKQNPWAYMMSDEQDPNHQVKAL